MRRAATFVLLALAACAPRQDSGQAAQPSGQVAQASAVPAEPNTPVLLRYRPPEEGGPSAYPEALVSGVLDLSGPCVRLQDAHGRTTTVVSSPGPNLGQDNAGLYVKAGTDRLRHGSSITGGGGWFDDFPGGLGLLDRPIPDACRSGPFVVVTGMERFDPADQPPPRSAPPPPAG